LRGSQSFRLFNPGLVENRLARLFWSFGFSLFELGQFSEGVSILGWMGHGVHEQVDVVRSVFEIIEWFKFVETVHELIKVLIERGLGGVSCFRNLTVSRFR